MNVLDSMPSKLMYLEKKERDLSMGQDRGGDIGLETRLRGCRDDKPLEINVGVGAQGTVRA